MERTSLFLLRDGLKKCFSKQLLKYKGSRIRVSAPDWYSFYVGRSHGYRAMGSEQSEEEEEERRRQNKTKWAILTVSVLDERTIPK